MRTVVAVLAVALLALAGCSSKSGPDNYTCQKTGRVIDLSKVTGSGKKGFDPESACPPPLPPSVVFTSLPKAMTAYFPATVAWKVMSGNYTAGHSMFNGIVLFHHPVADSALVAPDPTSTTSTLCSFAHQDVPAPFSCKIKFETPGTYGLRVYAQVRGDGLADSDFWSPQFNITVNPVNATGTTTEVTRAQGPAVNGQVGAFTPVAVSAKLGDGIVLVNSDVTAHVFSFSGVCKHADVNVAASTGTPVKSDPILMVVPGSCKITTDDAPSTQQVAINVAEPV